MRQSLLSDHEMEMVSVSGQSTETLHVIWHLVSAAGCNTIRQTSWHCTLPHNWVIARGKPRASGPLPIKLFGSLKMHEINGLRLTIIIDILLLSVGHFYWNSSKTGATWHEQMKIPLHCHDGWCHDVVMECLLSYSLNGTIINLFCIKAQGEKQIQSSKITFLYLVTFSWVVFLYV